MWRGQLRAMYIVSTIKSFTKSNHSVKLESWNALCANDGLNDTGSEHTLLHKLYELSNSPYSIVISQFTAMGSTLLLCSVKSEMLLKSCQTTSLSCVLISTFAFIYLEISICTSALRSKDVSL